MNKISKQDEKFIRAITMYKESISFADRVSIAQRTAIGNDLFDLIQNNELNTLKDWDGYQVMNLQTKSHFATNGVYDRFCHNGHSYTSEDFRLKKPKEIFLVIEKIYRENSK